MPLLPSSSWKLPGALLLLSLVPVAAGAVLIHIVATSMFCVLGAFQFNAAIRLRFPSFHRISGRVVAPSGVLAAATGLWMTAGIRIPAEQQGKHIFGGRAHCSLRYRDGMSFDGVDARDLAP